MQRRGLSRRSAQSPATILLVEDDPAIRRLAATLLELGGYVVLAAGSGIEALELAGVEPGRAIDLLVTDVVMPRMSGPELARRLGGMQPGLPVLFLSGYEEQSGGELSLDELGVRGEVAFLAKPFTPEAIHRAVRDALQREGTRTGARARVGAAQAGRSVEEA